MKPIIAVAVTLLAISPACAKLTFAAYDGPPLIHTGQGGTRVDNHGIDVWTFGDPARRFQVLGTISDTRQDKLLSGDVMSSSSIANKVREVGGSGLLLLGQNSAVTGYAGGGSTSVFGNTAIMNGGGRAIHTIATKFVVIRYLDPAQP